MNCYNEHFGRFVLLYRNKVGELLRKMKSFNVLLTWIEIGLAFHCCFLDSVMLAKL